jgi:hypothetical protein
MNDTKKSPTSSRLSSPSPCSQAPIRHAVEGFKVLDGPYAGRTGWPALAPTTLELLRQEAWPEFVEPEPPNVIRFRRRVRR